MELPVGLLNVSLILAILIGAVECFFGYKIFKTIMGLIGFLIGAILGASIGYALSSDKIIALIAGIVGGFIGAGLLTALFFLGMFLIGALLGGILGYMVFGLTHNDPSPIVIIILAIVVGILAVIFQKFMIIISTSFSGAWMLVTGLTYLLSGQASTISLGDLFSRGITSAPGALLGIILVGSAGVIIQYNVFKKLFRKRV